MFILKELAVGCCYTNPSGSAYQAKTYSQLGWQFTC